LHISADETENNLYLENSKNSDIVFKTDVKQATIQLDEAGLHLDSKDIHLKTDNLILENKEADSSSTSIAIDADGNLNLQNGEYGGDISFGINKKNGINTYSDINIQSNNSSLKISSDISNRITFTDAENNQIELSANTHQLDIKNLNDTNKALYLDTNNPAITFHDTADASITFEDEVLTIRNDSAENTINVESKVVVKSNDSDTALQIGKTEDDNAQLSPSSITFHKTTGSDEKKSASLEFTNTSFNINSDHPLNIDNKAYFSNTVSSQRGKVHRDILVMDKKEADDLVIKTNIPKNFDIKFNISVEGSIMTITEKTITSPEPGDAGGTGTPTTTTVKEISHQPVKFDIFGHSGKKNLDGSNPENDLDPSISQQVITAPAPDEIIVEGKYEGDEAEFLYIGIIGLPQNSFLTFSAWLSQGIDLSLELGE
ncbi:MAG: hypothetical protein MI922_11020, partial [Bacteroidales bacterium]|nr:hypothetical protein [Bacteroidales bacterium]